MALQKGWMELLCTTFASFPIDGPCFSIVMGNLQVNWNQIGILKIFFLYLVPNLIMSNDFDFLHSALLWKPRNSVFIYRIPSYQYDRLDWPRNSNKVRPKNNL